MNSRDALTARSEKIATLERENARLKRELDAAYLALTRMHACQCVVPTEREAS